LNIQRLPAGTKHVPPGRSIFRSEAVGCRHRVAEIDVNRLSSVVQGCHNREKVNTGHARDVHHKRKTITVLEYTYHELLK
jgi:hypothetical protein